MNNKSYIVLASALHGDKLINIGHPYTKRYDAERKAYDSAKASSNLTYYVAEIQTKYKATDVVVTELT